MIKRRNNKKLYESIMKSIATEVRHALNELHPDVYRRAADKREEQIKALPTKLRKMMGSNINSPAELRAHADKIEAEENIQREQENAKYEKNRKRLYNKLLKENPNIFKNKKLIQYYSCLAQYAFKYHTIKWEKGDEYIKRELRGLWENITSNSEILLYLDEGGWDYQAFDENQFSKFNEEELVVIGDIISDIIENTFNTVELVGCCYIADAWDKEIITTEDDEVRLDEEFGIYGKAVVIDIDGSLYVYYNYGNLIPIKKLGFKYILSGDFKGDIDEVINQAEMYNCTVIQYPDYSDCIVLSNSKRDLKNIEKYLWDEHIMAFGGVSATRDC